MAKFGRKPRKAGSGWTIRTKAVAMVTLIVIMCTALFSVLGVQRLKRHEESSAGLLMNMKCVSETAELRTLLEQIERSVSIMEHYIRTTLPTDEEVDVDYTAIVKYSEEAQAYFENLIASNPTAHGYFFRYRTDKYPTAGFWRVRSGESFKNASLTDFTQLDAQIAIKTEGLTRAMETGEPVWITPYWDESLGVYVISYIYPVTREDGQIRAVIGVDLDFSAIEEQTNEIAIYRTGYAFLVSADGKIITHPTLEPGTDISTLNSDLAVIVDKMTGENSGEELYSYTFEGVKKELAFSALPNGTRVVLCAPVSEIEIEKAKATVEFVTMGLIVCALAILIALWFIRRITAPLTELTEAAKRLENGEKDVVFPPVTADEVGVLNLTIQKTVRRQDKLVRDLSDMSFHDALTGLLNRHALDVKLNPSSERTYYVAMADVNKFKLFNDTYGHQVGDEVLKKAGRSLLAHFRKTDCYRYGGDEFLIISMDIGKEVFEQRVFDWRLAVSRLDVEGIDEKITVSCGMVSGKVKNKAELFDLIRKADEELYRIKKGKDAWEEDEEIIQDVYEAIDRGEIVPYFQPKVDVRNNNVIGAEALVRWLRDDGVVPPGSFLPILERTGDIRVVDRTVFELVCKQIQEWTRQGINVPTISSNFSMWHLKDEQFCEMLGDIADRYGVDRNHLEIEFTETVSVDETSRLLSVVQQLRQMGFRTALDDFGSGYSSLSILKNVPMDEVKLDRSLVSSWNNSTAMADGDRAMIKHIVGLVKDMQMMCLAEGVESVEQKNFLKSIGCNYVQGFLYDRPLPVAEFEKLLKAKHGHYDEPEEEEKAEAAEVIPETAVKTANILLAEDNEINREITVNILDALGVNVVTAEDGLEALERFKASEEGYFSMVLMDIQMPVMDGYQSTKEIRELAREDAKDVPIIAVTVDAYRETREQAEAAGMTGYVTKPLDPNRLTETMAKYGIAVNR